MTQIKVIRGSTIDFTLTWTDENGDALDLTNCTADVFDNDRCPAMTHTVVDAAAGKTRLYMEWPRNESGDPDDAAILAFPQTFFCRPRVVFSPSYAESLDRITFNA